MYMKLPGTLSTDWSGRDLKLPRIFYLLKRWMTLEVTGLPLSALILCHHDYTFSYCRMLSQWPRGLRHRSAAARLLELWVRVPPGLCILLVSCVVRQRSLLRADHWSRGVLQTVMRRCVWSSKPHEWGGPGPWLPAKEKLAVATYCLHQIPLTKAVDRELNHGTDGTRRAAVLFISLEMTRGIYPHTKQGRILLAR